MRLPGPLAIFLNLLSVAASLGVGWMAFLIGRVSIDRGANYSPVERAFLLGLAIGLLSMAGTVLIVRLRYIATVLGRRV